MARWICDVCGYAHVGPEPPERCPQCGASKYQFHRKGMQGGCLFSMVFFIVLIALLCFTFCSCNSSVTVDNSTVQNVEVDRFLGKWYEIARFDHKFERGMKQCTATYTMQKDGTIKISNQGIKNGELKTSVGKAKTTSTAGLLRVTFFAPFYSDYRILMLPSDYSYALVGSNRDDYLWILSRTPQISKYIREKIILEAQRRNYNTSNLIWVDQTNHL